MAVLRPNARVCVLTGPSRAGKTTVCRAVIATARARGLDVAGVLTEDGTADDGSRLQFVTNLRTGERRLLAAAGGRGGADPAPAAFPKLGWAFEEDGVAFGGTVLEACRHETCDLLVVDQLGPLELLQGRGWTVAFDALADGRYGLALVVVNPRVLDAARRRVGNCVAHFVNEANRDELPATICAAHLPAGECLPGDQEP